MPNRITGLKYILFTAVMVLGVALISEGLLQFACLISRKASSMLVSCKAPLEIKDPQLGRRPNPAYPEHDNKGFQNPSVPEQVDIVALGDSQTYGWGLPAESAWPRQLAKMSDFTTYTMAWGGYGPTHSVILLEEAISLHPKLVIEAFYSGNDLHDSYCHVYHDNQLTWLKSGDEALQRRIQKAEDDETLDKSIARPMSVLYTVAATSSQQDQTTSHSIVREWFSAHSRLYGLLRAVRRMIGNRGAIRKALTTDDWESQKQYAQSNARYLDVCEEGQLRTILTPAYRFAALNLEDPRISEGKSISLKAIEALRDRTQAKNIGFMVLLIPTKELVFKELALRHPERMSSQLQELIKSEEAFWAETKDFLDKQSIRWLDALPALRQCLEEGHQPYQITPDGHPNAIGHEALAKVVLAGIQNAGKNLKR